MLNSINGNHIPHHPLPPHLGPHSRRNMVSVIYDEKKMSEVYGELWPFHFEKISSEPPEMKLLFALEMGFKVVFNEPLVQEMKKLYQNEPNCGFANPSLDEKTLELFANTFATEKDVISLILEHAPTGVVAILLAVAKEKHIADKGEN